MPVDPYSLAFGAAMQIPKLVVGISQTRKANKALKALGEQQYPEYANSPEMINAYNRAEAMAKYGYSPEERAKFEQDLARQQAGTFEQATNLSGGNLSSAIGGVLQANNTDAINKFAAGGAELKRQNIQYADSLAQKLQQQKNLQTQNLIARRQMLEQSYGQAKSSGLSNIAGAFASIGAIGAQSALGAIGAGASGTAKAVDQNVIDIDNELAASKISNDLLQQKVGIPSEGNGLTYEEQMQSQQDELNRLNGNTGTRY